MKIQVLHIWCKCASVVLKRGYISEMSLSIACRKKKRKKKGLLRFAGELNHGTTWVTLLWQMHLTDVSGANSLF